MSGFRSTHAPRTGITAQVIHDLGRGMTVPMLIFAVLAMVLGIFPGLLLRPVEALAARLQAQGLNIDYFPTNFLLREGRLVYVDYECNDYMEQWDFAHWGRNYWAKTPEFLACAAERGDLPAGEEEHP